jgi:hypothetical protein
MPTTQLLEYYNELEILVLPLLDSFELFTYDNLVFVDKLNVLDSFIESVLTTSNTVLDINSTMCDNI